LKKRLALVLFILFAAFVYRSSVFRITKNFSVVDEGRLFRSAQLNESEMAELVEKYQIKTVISLRGSPDETFFYKAEAQTLDKLNVKFEYLGMSDNHYPHQDEVNRLLKIFKKGAYPMLIHCRVGADRTGMVAGLYKKLIMNQPVEKALEELSLSNYHIKSLHPAMNLFVRRARDINWVTKEYNVCDAEFAQYRRPEYDCP
jgi:protein tyrosine/serine phosphatase